MSAELSLPSTRLPRVLTPEAFDRLLTRFDADRNRAAEKYEEARRALITYFAFRNLLDPLTLADETLNRVAYRLAEGEEIQADNPLVYCYAVARNVWREQLARPMQSASLDELEGVADVASPEALRLQFEEELAAEGRLAQLRECLNRLGETDRALLLAYYQERGRAKIEKRQTLAARLGITIGSLRNRASRLRERLADCIGGAGRG